MLYDLFEGLRDFRVSFDHLRSVELGGSENENEAKRSFILKSHDLIGGTLAFIDAYKEHLAWCYADTIEINAVPHPQPPLAAERMIDAIRDPESLSAEEQERMRLYSNLSRLSLQRMMESSACKKESGYEIQANAARDRFASTIKSFAFFGRALQDGLYRYCLASQGHGAGPHSSMAKLFKNRQVKHDSPAAPVVCAVGGYDQWFLDFRDKRNRIKEGVGGSYLGPQPDLGIGFGRRFKDGKPFGPESFRVSDVKKCLIYSARLTHEIARQSEALN